MNARSKIDSDPRARRRYLDGVWNDDWHHAAIVALTGRNEAYYTDYTWESAGIYFCGKVWLSSIRTGVFMAGSAARISGSLGLRTADLRVAFIDNHDQVSNSAFADRCALHKLHSGRYQRDDSSCCCSGRGRRCSSRARNSARRHPFVTFSDVGDEKLRKRCGKAVSRFLPQVSFTARSEDAAAIVCRMTRRTFRREQARLGVSGKGKSRALPPDTAICSDCVGDSRLQLTSAGAWMDGP
jgi:maltooligosyltrehalose trehalohydrolase